MSEEISSVYDSRLTVSEGVFRRPVSFQSGNETLAGDLVLPARPGPHPAVLAVAGTGPQNRYGDMVLADGRVLPHSRYIWISHWLAQAGFASLYWDKRGVAQSTGGVREPGDPPGIRDSYTSLLTDVDDAASALQFLAEQPEVERDRIAVMGRSAGVHFSSILAARTDLPAAYILTGGVHMGIDEFMELIYEEVLAYAARGPREEEWVLAHMSDFYGAARHWREMLTASRRGEAYYEWSDGDNVVRKYLARLKEELEYPLYDQFRHIKKPVLICHGDKDVNVPVQEADKIFGELQGAGNPDVTLVIIPGADHSMRIGPPGLDDETRFRERTDYPYSYPFSEFFIHSVIGWLSDRFNYLQAA